MSKAPMLSALGGLILIAATEARQPAMSAPKHSIAHRGASGYAPEHTLVAYQMALDQGADFVEPDLAVSRDRQLICLHDDSLERTTNVEQVFPERYSRDLRGRAGTRQWIANDLTVEEIKQLDAGRWKSEAYAGARVPTWDEMIEIVRGKAGIYPELKSPSLYTARGVDMVRIFVDSIKQHELDTAASLTTTPIIIQSFDEATVRRVAMELPTIPRIFLTSSDDDVSEPRLHQLATFASGVALEKGVIARHPDMVAQAHALGLTVTGWTFRADEKTVYPNVRDEMAQFLYGWGIDAVFTNNPDLFPRR
jgi:glycerophosphoryl diester phosphodiesterase